MYNQYRQHLPRSLPFLLPGSLPAAFLWPGRAIPSHYSAMPFSQCRADRFAGAACASIRFFPAYSQLSPFSKTGSLSAVRFDNCTENQTNSHGTCRSRLTYIPPEYFCHNPGNNIIKEGCLAQQRMIRENAFSLVISRYVLHPETRIEGKCCLI